MRSLKVLVNGVPVGKLTEETQGYCFVYEEDYVSSASPSLSVLLPRQNGVFHSETLFPFFVNILPEGANRRMICRSRKIDEDDDFSLLCSMAGADFIGGLTFETV